MSHFFPSNKELTFSWYYSHMSFSITGNTIYQCALEGKFVPEVNQEYLAMAEFLEGHRKCMVSLQRRILNEYGNPTWELVPMILRRKN